MVEMIYNLVWFIGVGRHLHQFVLSLLLPLSVLMDMYSELTSRLGHRNTWAGYMRNTLSSVLFRLWSEVNNIQHSAS